MKKNVTIKDNRIFRRMYSKGRSAVTTVLVVYCRPNGRRPHRMGVNVSSKVGSAVVRNRARRRLREIYRLAQPGMKQGYDVVLVARARTADGPYDRLNAAFQRACRELGIAVPPVEKG